MEVERAEDRFKDNRGDRPSLLRMFRFKTAEAL
jgi:hypothetical protein